MRSTRGTRRVANATEVLHETIVEAYRDGVVTGEEQARLVQLSLDVHVLAEHVDHKFKLGLRLLDSGDVDRDLVSQAKGLAHWCQTQKSLAMDQIARLISQDLAA